MTNSQKNENRLVADRNSTIGWVIFHCFYYYFFFCGNLNVICDSSLSLASACIHCFFVVWREQGGLGCRVSHNRSRRVYGSSRRSLHLASTAGNKCLHYLTASLLLLFHIHYDWRLWLYRQVYAHELSLVDAYANTRLTWPTIPYLLNCLKIFVCVH